MSTDDRKPLIIADGAMGKGPVHYIKVDETTRRKAQCCYCNRVSESRNDLPFFKLQFGLESDHYYCGCKGWD